nr:hypothetical protein CFP56_28840 [Quercus suber]
MITSYLVVTEALSKDLPKAALQAKIGDLLTAVVVATKIFCDTIWLRDRKIASTDGIRDSPERSGRTKVAYWRVA